MVEHLIFPIFGNIQHYTVVQPCDVVLNTACNFTYKGNRLVSGSVILEYSSNLWWFCEEVCGGGGVEVGVQRWERWGVEGD